MAEPIGRGSPKVSKRLRVAAIQKVPQKKSPAQTGPPIHAGLFRYLRRARASCSNTRTFRTLADYYTDVNTCFGHPRNIFSGHTYFLEPNHIDKNVIIN